MNNKCIMCEEDLSKEEMLLCGSCVEKKVSSKEEALAVAKKVIGEFYATSDISKDRPYEC